MQFQLKQSGEVFHGSVRFTLTTDSAGALNMHTDALPGVMFLVERITESLYKPSSFPGLFVRTIDEKLNGYEIKVNAA